MRRLQSGSGILLALILSACGGSPRVAPVDEIGSPGGTASRTPAPESAVQPPPKEAQTRPLPETGGGAPRTGADDTAVPGRTANPAVVALLNDANRASSAGRHAHAAASLERALSIEPQSAWLWHRLALIRLAQENLGQAAALAAKSNSLAGNDRRLQSDNWRLIAEVHRRRGENTAAKSATENASRLAAP